MSRVSVDVCGCLTQTGRGRRRGGYIRILYVGPIRCERVKEPRDSASQSHHSRPTSCVKLPPVFLLLRLCSLIFSLSVSLHSLSYNNHMCCEATNGTE